jgi:hypothetical protein
MLKYNSKFYIVSLFIVIVILILLNMKLLIADSQFISVIPLLIQIPILYLIINKQKPLTTLIKIWAWIIVIGGIGGWFSTLANLAKQARGNEFREETLTFLNILYNSLRILIPIYFLIFVKSIVLISEEPIIQEEKENNSIVNNSL